MDCSQICPPQFYKVYKPDGTCKCVDRRYAYAYSICAWNPGCDSEQAGDGSGIEFPGTELIEEILTSILAASRQLIDGGDVERGGMLSQMISDLAPVESTNLRLLEESYTLQQEAAQKQNNLSWAAFNGTFAQVAAAAQGKVQPVDILSLLRNAVSQDGIQLQSTQYHLLGLVCNYQAEHLSATPLDSSVVPSE